MWEISNALQAIDFLRAAVFGVILAVFYGIFSSLRKVGMDSDFAVFIEDIIFFIISAPTIFLFLLATTNGELRLYIIIGILIGFLSFKFTFYKIYVFLLSRLFSLIKFLTSFLSGMLLKLASLISVFFDKMGKKIKNFKKAVNTFKKGLKKSH